MNTSDAIAASTKDAHRDSAGNIPPSRLVYWSIMREFWESPSIYMAPVTVAGVYLAAYLLGAALLPGHQPTRAMARHPGSSALAQPYDFAAVVVMLTVVLLQLLYCLDALYGERRDRSILFWKSLPVSDWTTVLAKASVPTIILPLFGLLVTVVTQFGVLLIASMLVLITGGSVTTLWGQSSLLYPAWLLGYHLIAVHTLWYAPIYCWILLVSAWTKRSPIIWVVFPPLAIYAAERLLFGTSYFASMLQARLLGSSQATSGSDVMEMGIGTHITPGAFLTNPSLWIGLAVAAAFLWGAARLRRYHEPV
jgi:ABC-2 type transport system permease protein